MLLKATGKGFINKYEPSEPKLLNTKFKPEQHHPATVRFSRLHKMATLIRTNVQP